MHVCTEMLHMQMDSKHLCEGFEWMWRSSSVLRIKPRQQATSCHCRRVSRTESPCKEQASHQKLVRSFSFPLVIKRHLGNSAVTPPPTAIILWGSKGREEKMRPPHVLTHSPAQRHNWISLELAPSINSAVHTVQLMFWLIHIYYGCTPVCSDEAITPRYQKRICVIFAYFTLGKITLDCVED